MNFDSGFEIFDSEFDCWILESGIEGWVKEMRL
jgi:hypothetical protein